MTEGGKKQDFNWLSVESADYGDPAFAQILVGKLRDFTTGAVGQGCNLHYNNVAIAYTHLYGFDMEGVGANANQVTRSGEQGSIAELRIPEAAGLLAKAWNIVVGPEMAWSADATTTDSASIAQAITARNALKYYWVHEGFGAALKQLAWDAMGFAESILHIPWDPELGVDVGVQPADPATGAPARILKAGDIAVRSVPTWDIIRDPTLRSFESGTFIILREWQNKYDVAARCDTEEKRAACLQATAEVEAYGQGWAPFMSTYSDTAQIPVYYLYAKRTPSCPGGRQTVFLNDGTTLEDKPLDEAYCEPNGTLPVVRMATGSYRGTPWPYTKFFGTLGAEQAMDALTRDLLTNATATSGNVLAVPESMMDSGAAVAFQSGGPQMVSKPNGSTDKIDVLQLQQSHPEHFKLRQTLGGCIQSIIGLDQLTAGNDAAMPSSGALAALMTSTSVQNNSQTQASYVAASQQAANIVLRHIQFHMTTPKRIALAGNARMGLVGTAEVDGTKVDGIQRVFATIGSAMQQTDAGKNEIATIALKEKWVQTPEQLQTVWDSGRLDALNQGLSNELVLISNENEAISRGEVPPVVLSDNHRLHIKEHRDPIASLGARNNPGVIEAQQAHTDWHIRILRETDPQILQALGQEPMAPAAAPGVPGQPTPAPGNEAPQEQAKAAGPSMPKIAGTDEKPQQIGTTPPALAVKPN